jgi:NinB protein
MSATRTFILKSRLDVESLRRFLEARWKECAGKGWPLAVEIHEQRGQRSLAQNRAYWAILGDISADAWVNDQQYDAETWHAFFAGRFIGWHELPGGDRAPISTTTLDVAEFAAYLEKIQAYAATELGQEFA